MVIQTSTRCVYKDMGAVKLFLLKHHDQYNGLVFKSGPRGVMENSAESLLGLIGQSQDRAAFKSLYTQYHSKIYHYLLKSGASSEQALEITQECFLKIWKKAHLYKSDKGSASTWIFTLVRNSRYDNLRKQINDPLEVSSQDIYPDDIASEVDHDLFTLYQKSEAKAVIETLSQEQQDVLNSVYGLGLSHNEYAERAQIPLGTVKSRLRLAIGQIRARLED